MSSKRLFYSVAVFTLLLFTATLYLSCKKESPVSDPCKGVFCMNGGNCVGGTCNCPSGFTGANCETLANPCVFVTCQNGGYCSDGTCNCPTGTTGTTCELIYRETYTNTYVGTGIDENNTLYPNTRFTLTLNGENIFNMHMRMISGSGILLLSEASVRLEEFSSESTTFSIGIHHQGDYTYWGNGTISTTKMTLNLREEHTSGNVTNYTFSYCPKE